MDGLTFIAEIAKALAWPTAAVLLGALFRKQLSDLSKAITKGKFGNLEFEFARRVADVAASLPDLPSTSVSPSTMGLAAANPRGAILEAWLAVEEQVITLALTRGLTNATARRYPLGSIQAIAKSGLLSPNHVLALSELQQLRNRATHDPDFSPDPFAVVSYVQLANDLKNELKRLMPPTSGV
ncbi:hypothetical protein JFU47_12270 [Pseudomonas sp. TH39(2020)]|uniref:hypothetical protein n=1 Tax=Pseudomonas sp. TH39(2020) TaxID=2796349 RepID=UPI001912EC2D|nr:hypothetical protein [Pseudomonas sp. TH39(2020)]MBK5397472.1 hypothetical protein [Pseudomonas sp. TH39(2020)]